MTAQRRGDQRRLVVVVVPDFFPTIGGTVRQAMLQALGMRQRGYDVVVLTRRYDGSWDRTARVDELDVIRFGRSGRGTLSEKMSLLALAFWFARHRRRIAMVQTIMYSDYALAASLVGLRSRLACVWAAHGEATDVIGDVSGRVRGMQRRIRRSVLAGCHHVALTGAIRDELAAQGLAGASIEVIPVPVEVTRFRPPTVGERAASRAKLGIGPQEVVFVFTGRFVLSKGLGRLIEAFARLRSDAPATRLLLVGGGSAEGEAQVDADAARWELGDRLLLAGVVSDVEHYLWAGDVFVLPSVREGLSNSLVEAMACGLACVAAAEAGGDQVLYDGAGLIPPSSDADDLYDTLRTLALDPGLREQIGATAADRTRSFTPERVAERYERLVLPPAAVPAP